MKKEFLLVIILLAIIIAVLVVALIFIPAENNSPVRLYSIKSGQAITSPLAVEGEAKGAWFFEASFPIKITDGQGNVLGSSYASAQSDWMTEDFVPFKAELTYASESDGKGFLVLSKDNPSGLPEHDQAVKIPVVLSAVGHTTTKVFFNNNQMDPEISCNKVFPIERQIPKTKAVAKAALEELLMGPTDSEKVQGYFSSIPTGSKLNSISIVDGKAMADFDQTTESGGGSCSMAARVAQITETLKQFPTVKNVVISINGRTEDILQP